jgi:predicted metal-binding membrane protein
MIFPTLDGVARTASRRTARVETVASPVAGLATLTLLAWVATVHNTRAMSMMAMGLVDVGRAMPFRAGLAEFMRMWAAMIVAMMIPAAAPAVLRRAHQDRGHGSRGKWIVRVVGYLLVWTGLGVVAFAAVSGMRHVTAATDWLRRGGGAVLVVAALYQFTPWKRRCLQACQSQELDPLTVGASRFGAFAAGTVDGLSCVAACWALMTILLVVGLMNLTWMVALTIVFVAERNWPGGWLVAQLAGAGLLAVGLAVIAFPSLLSWLGAA